MFAAGSIGVIAANTCTPSGGEDSPPTSLALADIPPDYLTAYQAAGRDLDISWQFLAAIGKQESDHGRRPSATRVNSSGCAGPMQLGVGGACGDFFDRYKLDGDGNGRFDVYDRDDAIYTAANGLRRGKGAPGRSGSREAYQAAACAYYGACADASANYATEVMDRADAYGAVLEESVEVSAGAEGSVEPEALDAWLKRTKPESPLVGYGAAFVRVAAGGGLDPRLLVAIAGQETSFATTGNAVGIQNPFGLGPGIRYASWDAAIQAAAGNLARNYIATGLVTISQIGARWAPVGAANDPGRLNSNWVDGVSRIYRQLGGDPTQPVTTVSTPVVSACSPPGVTDEARARIVQVLSAEGDLALTEEGRNCGQPLVRYYAGRCGIQWCAIFASWVWRQAGVQIPVIAYTGDFKTWSEQYGEWKPAGGGRRPEPGDVVLYDRSADGHFDHVNVVEKVLPDGSIVMVGGNTAGVNAAGNGVRRKAPHDWTTDQTITGFASPIPVT